MFEITVESTFSSAHQLREYKGSCENLHGHNWRVMVSVGSEGLDSLGMVVDFRVLKREVEAVIERLDHKFINEVPPFDSINPTAENISKYIYEEISKSLASEGVKILKVKVWESEKAAATYYE
ncbi:MAG: 6-carboxytetrahydropterin synthase QueD [Proteobacteria bacterium]|nr:6-carboxytetrahydropterin synthase QueD [Pseudomonadota bacterium]